MCFETPQSSSFTAWYSGVISSPIALGIFDLALVPPIEITKKTAILYRVKQALFTYNCGADAFNTAIIASDFPYVQLCTTEATGEYVLNNHIALGSEQKSPCNSWHKAKSSGEGLFIKPQGKIDGAAVGLLGFPVLNILCRFQIEGINDKDFLQRFSGGCI